GGKPSSPPPCPRPPPSGLSPPSPPRGAWGGSFVCCRVLGAGGRPPPPRHVCTRASTGRRCAISSASAFDAASMVTRTDRAPPLGRPAGAWSAGHTPATHAHVSDEQDDEDNAEDDVGDHCASILSQIGSSCQVPLRFLSLQGFLDGLRDDLAGGLGVADAVAEHVRRQPRDVLAVDRPPPLRRRPRLRRRH